MTLNQLIRQASKAWHGVKVGHPDWGDHSHSLAFEAVLRREAWRVYIILNAYWEPLEFELPSVDDSGASPSRRSIDTALESPQDIVPRQTAPAWSGLTYRTAAHSVVVPFAEIRRRPPPIGQEQERPKGAQWERRGQAESQRLAGQIRIVDGERGPYGRAGDQESKADDACRSQRPSSQEATPAIALLDRQAATGFAVSLRGTTPGVAVKPEAR